MRGEAGQPGFHQPQQKLGVPPGGAAQRAQRYRNQRFGKNVFAGIQKVGDALHLQRRIENAAVFIEVTGDDRKIPAARILFPQQPADGAGGKGAFGIDVSTSCEGNIVCGCLQRTAVRQKAFFLEAEKCFAAAAAILRKHNRFGYRYMLPLRQLLEPQPGAG